MEIAVKKRKRKKGERKKKELLIYVSPRGPVTIVYTVV